MKRAAVLAGSILLLLGTAATAQERADTLKGFGEFFENTQPGQLAIIVGAQSKGRAKKLERMLPVKPDEETTIARTEAGWFVINHGTATEVGAQENRTYLAVLVIPVFKPKYSGNPSLTLYRNLGWTRIGPSWRGNPAYGFHSGELQKTYATKPSAEFLQLHKQDDIGKLDAFLQTKFHGTPSGSEFSSWDEHAFWSRNLDDIGICRQRPQSCIAKAYLLGFTPTDTPQSQSPLIFYSNPNAVERMHIWTYSPSDEAYAQYYSISFSD